MDCFFESYGQAYESLTPRPVFLKDYAGTTNAVPTVLGSSLGLPGAGRLKSTRTGPTSSPSTKT